MDVVSRRLVDLSLLQSLPKEHPHQEHNDRRRSSVKSTTVKSAKDAETLRTETAKAQAASEEPEMTVDIGKLSAVLAKQWSEVTKEEVEMRRLNMQKLKAAKAAPKATVGEVEIVDIDTLYEVDKAGRQNSKPGTRQSSKSSALSDVTERQVSKTTSLASGTTGSRLNSKSAVEAGEPEETPTGHEDIAPAAIQEHLSQWRSWRREGRLPSAPVQLPPAAVPAGPSRPRGTEARQEEAGGQSRHPRAGAHLPSSDISERYIAGFQDRDLDRLLQEIAQTPTDDGESREFVWPPRRAKERTRKNKVGNPPKPAQLPVVQGRGITEQQSTTSESWMRAFTSRADSPAWLLDALDSRASSRASRENVNRASPAPDRPDGKRAEDQALPSLPPTPGVERRLL